MRVYVIVWFTGSELSCLVARSFGLLPIHLIVDFSHTLNHLLDYALTYYKHHISPTLYLPKPTF